MRDASPCDFKTSAAGQIQGERAQAPQKYSDANSISTRSRAQHFVCKQGNRLKSMLGASTTQGKLAWAAALCVATYLWIRPAGSGAGTAGGDYGSGPHAEVGKDAAAGGSQLGVKQREEGMGERRTD